MDENPYDPPETFERLRPRRRSAGDNRLRAIGRAGLLFSATILSALILIALSTPRPSAGTEPSWERLALVYSLVFLVVCGVITWLVTIVLANRRIRSHEQAQTPNSSYEANAD